MSDIHALSGAYSIDALDDTERSLFEAHLTECADCRAEVASLREAAAKLAETTAVPPPPALREQILADITKVRPLPPLPSQQPTPVSLDSRRRRRFPILAAAAAVVAAMTAGTVAVHPWDRDQGTENRLTAAEQIVAAPDAQTVTKRFPDGARATVVRSRSLGKAVLLTSDLPAAPSGRVYQLWLALPNQGMVSAGLMPKAGDQTVVLDGDAGQATAAGISVEPVGGSRVPTTEPIALFTFAQGT